MKVRPGIHIAILLILGGALRVAEPAEARPPLRQVEQPAAVQDLTGTAGDPPPPPITLRHPAAEDPEPPLPPPPPADIRGREETLSEAWAIALAVDQGLEATQWGVSSARESLQSARAQRWPTVALESSYTVYSDDQAFRFGFPGMPLPVGTFSYAQDESFGFRTKVDLPLFTSGRIPHAVAAAAAKVSSAELHVEDATNDLKLRVAGEYVEVLRAERDVGVAESNVRSLEAHARDVQMRFNQDQVPRNDLLAAEVALSNARQQAIQAANRLDVSRAAYNRRLGRPLTAGVRIAELPVEAVEGDVEGLTARALRRRPEIARLSAQVRALRSQATSLRAGNRPQFGLWGQYAFEENRYRVPEGIASVGVGVTWNVFDGGRNHHEAAALLRQAEGLLRLRAELQSMIALNVRQAWLEVQETRQRLKVTSEAIERAEENVRVARKRYLAGVGINTEVLDAETLRTETYRNHYNATYEAVLAVLRLRHATGDLGQ